MSESQSESQSESGSGSQQVLRVVGTVPAHGWRYVRNVRGEDGQTTTYTVDAFLVTADGRLLPVAFHPVRGTVHLAEEAGVVLLQTHAARVSWDEHFGTP